MKNVLYLSYDGMTDPLGQSQVLPYLIGLSKKGFQFTLISFEKPERYSSEKSKIEALCTKHRIEWKPLIYTKKPPVISTLRDIRRMKKLTFQLHTEKHFQLVHCRSYISALIGLQLKKDKGVKLLFDMRGFWADERVEGKIWNLKNPLFKFIYSYFKKKEKHFFEESDAIVSLTEVGKKEILSWNLQQVSVEKITVIPCCVDLNLFNPEKINSDHTYKKKTEYKLKEKYVVGYIGSIGTWYQLREMLLSFKHILQLKQNAVFLFVTKESPATIHFEAQNLEISPDAIRVVEAQHHKVPAFISLFDCSIFFIRPSYSKKASSPTKQGEIMAMGIPLICNAGVGDTDEIVTRYNAGLVLKDTTEETISSFSLDFATFDREKTMLGAKEYFGLDHGVESYFKIYDQFVG
ncbi:glycosyltransferase [Fluviicola taffensis]|uniref:Glycosyl transferase group 1 n=1 Tax=Fluviicola taffensis (strain DSM 16823 / NCIMB 13979 / RW262) TaxID=755732 RepID=F2II36_FLUTR|nr:glycosyltransferase [Fluviicola taffensis]AEA42736.1 glycosyl transferase group 1 [Fluviicola taffensis DSM 16823]